MSLFSTSFGIGLGSEEECKKEKMGLQRRLEEEWEEKSLERGNGTGPWRRGAWM